jgi:hypothetical protein
MTRHSSGTGDSLHLGYATATGAGAYRVVAPAGKVVRDVRSKDVESAVFSYIQARRALGATTINTGDIATALRLPRREVEEAVKRLANRGVKPMNG